MVTKDDFELEELRHKHHMIEIEAKRDAELMVSKAEHDHNMEFQRIREAGIRKSINQKNSMKFEGYP